MKTTVEIPSALIRRAKSEAAKQGISFRQFVTEAITAHLQSTAANSPKPWMKHLGKLKGLRKETRCTNKIIEEASEKIDSQ